MNQQARAKQIQQMVNFMKLEARDKANEIRVKTDHDCVVEHQKLVFAAKKKLEAEFAKREKNLEVQKRVKESQGVMQMRMKKLVDRDSMLREVLETARERINAIAATPAYAELLTGFIVQGVHQLNAKDVAVVGRVCDAKQVHAAIAAAQSQLPDVTLKFSQSDTLPDSCGGGVVLTTHGGRITCDNTLQSRLEVAFHDLAPVVRHIVFPSNRALNRKHPPTATASAAAAAPTSEEQILVDLLS